MDDLSVVTFLHLVPHRADCECTNTVTLYERRAADCTDRFAFVEYESRRDADDAYHEMHNKRIGRDDLLKIEVGDSLQPNLPFSNTWKVGAHTTFGFLAL